MDSDDLAAERRKELSIPRHVAEALGRSAVEAATAGYYVSKGDRKVDWSSYVKTACSKKRSIPPDAPLPKQKQPRFSETRVQVTNETTLQAAWRFSQSGLRPLALNFANGIHPGCGLLQGARRRKCSADRVLCTQH